MAPTQITLWSSLVKTSAKREITCPPGLDVTREQFAGALKAKIGANQLPASAELVRVNWDETGTVPDLVLVRYAGNDSKANVLRFAVGLEQLGRFVYLEKKVLLAPPSLHKVRSVKEALAEPSVESPAGPGISLLVIGAILLVVAFAWFDGGGGIDASSLVLCIGPGIIFVLFGLGLIASSQKTKQKAETHNEAIREKNREIEAWNVEARKERDSLARNLDDWQIQVLQVAYLGQSNDMFGRWISAISTTVDQVIHDLFIARQAQASAWDEQQRTKEEIEKELQRRRQEAFS